MDEIPAVVTEALDGQRFNRDRVCDACGAEFEIGDETILYLTDVLIGVRHERVETPLVVSMFCAGEGCVSGRIDSLPIPWSEAAEALVEAEVDAGWVIGHEQRVLDFSPRGDGIDWNPLEIPEAFAGQAAPVFLKETGKQDISYGAQDMVVTLYRFGVRPEEYILSNGEFDIPEEDLSNIRKQTLLSMVDNSSLTSVFESVGRDRVLSIAKRSLRSRGVTKYSEL